MVYIKNKRAVSVNLIFYHKRTIKIHLNVQDTRWKGELIRRNDFILIQPRLRKSNGEHLNSEIAFSSSTKLVIK